MSTLKTLVATAVSEPTNEKMSPPDQNLEGYTSVIITLGDGTTTTVFAKWNQRFDSNAIQTIWDVVGKYKAGAW